MKLCYLLVVAVTLLASCVATSTSDLFQPPNNAVAARTKGNTVLRGLKPKPMNDTDDEIEKREREATSIRCSKNGKATVEEKFNTPEGLMLAKASNDRFMKIYKLYGLFNFLGKAAFIQWLKGIKAAAQK
ncbi:hypothetical protein GQ600_3115 [Phytophthora cactorum]|nr:hypothetical protein GQ600_3115 [Phytophthora cactorum]